MRTTFTPDITVDIQVFDDYTGEIIFTNEYTLGDIDREVLDDFVTLLDREVDFENQKLYM